MSEIDERLDRGVAIFRRAGDDSALLGAALLAFHGALEHHLDAELRDQPGASAQDRTLLDVGRVGWLARANLAEQAGLLSHAQRDQALEVTRVRLLIARGDACPWLADAVQSYGRMVTRVCGRMELLRQIDQRSERARATVASPIPSIYPAPNERRRFPILQLTITVLFFVTLAGVVWTIYTQLDGSRLLRAVGAGSAPTAVQLQETLAPSPAPVERKARVSGLGGGPGWLHATPSFDSPTRAIPLADGMDVTLRDDQQTDSSGTRWQLVEVGGYEGWCPENNLVFDTKGG